MKKIVEFFYVPVAPHSSTWHAENEKYCAWFANQHPNETPIKNLKKEFLEIPTAVKSIGWVALIPATCLLAFVALVTFALWK